MIQRYCPLTNQYIGYSHNEKKLSYWRTYNGKEIDAVIGAAEIGIEVKSTSEIKPKHRSNSHFAG